jgi:hypothetical protein
MNGIQYYINDLNKRFTNKLYVNNKRRISGLARIDLDTGIPSVKVGNDYVDALFDDNLDLTLFYFEPGDRKEVADGFNTTIDLIVCVNTSKFTDIDEEDFIDEVFEIMKVTSFQTIGYVRDQAALKEFKYPEQITETMHPFFVFRVKNKLVGKLKQINNNEIIN